MKRLEWADAVRVLSLLVTAFFVAAAVLQAVLAFDVLGPPPEPVPDFIDSTVARFAWEQSRWPVEFAATVLFGLGFAALAGVGLLLSRLADSADARRILTAAAFAGGGIIGALSQLWWLAVQPVNTSPQYCDCGLRAEEIMARLMAINAADSVQLWLVIGAMVLSSIGVLTAAALGRSAGAGEGWVWLSYVTALAGLVGVVIAALRIETLDLLALLLVAGILLPLWALWLATQVGGIRPPDEPAAEMPSG